MAIVFDPNKSRRNVEVRGIPFALADAFDWTKASIETDGRRNYGEVRYVAVGPIAQKLHVLVFTLRGRDIRVISLRRANSREQRLYGDRT